MGLTFKQRHIWFDRLTVSRLVGSGGLKESYHVAVPRAALPCWANVSDAEAPLQDPTPDARQRMQSTGKRKLAARDLERFSRHFSTFFHPQPSRATQLSSMSTSATAPSRHCHSRGPYLFWSSTDCYHRDTVMRTAPLHGRSRNLDPRCGDRRRA